MWLEQRGLQQTLYWHTDARAMLDLQGVLDIICVVFALISYYQLLNCIGLDHIDFSLF